MGQVATRWQQGRQASLKGINKAIRRAFLKTGAAALVSALICLETAGAAETVFSLDIPASPATEALDRLAEITGHSLFYPAGELESVVTSALDGSFALQEALDALLKGTRLNAVVTERGVIVVSMTPDTRQVDENEESNVKKELSLLSKVVLLLFGTTATQGLAAQDSAVADEGQDIIEEVLVKGVRKSLADSLSLKRDSVGVVEGLFAEDIGKFPDLHLGDALQRIPGVTLERDFASNGEGRRINVRGLPSAFVRTTLNGITAATSATDGQNMVRSFDYDIFASELFQSITVTKTPSADIAEGGLTATVNLQTPRPFDFDERQLIVSAAGTFAQQHDDSSDLGAITPRVAALFSDNFGNWGLTATLAYSEVNNRGDWTQGWRWGNTGSAFLTNTLNGADRTAGTADDLTQADIDAGGFTVNGQAATLAQLQSIAADTIAPLLPRVGPLTLDRERLGVTGTLQFAPTDNLTLTADLLYATFDDIQYRGTIDGLTGFGRRGVMPHSLRIREGALVAGTLGNITQRTESVEDAFENEFTHFTLEADWDISGEWKAYGQFGYSAAETSELRRTYLFRHTGEFTFDMTDALSPQFFGTGFDYLDPNDYMPGGFRFRPRDREDDEYSFRADLERIFDGGVLAKVKAGVRYSNKEVSQVRGERRNFDGSVDLDTSTLDFNDFARSAADFAPGFLDGFAAGTPKDFLLIDPAAGAGFLPRSLTATVPVDPLATFDVKEEAYAAYIKTEWDISLVTVDLGLRAVRTEQTSNGSQVVGGISEPISVDNQYTDVLPSLNIRFDLSDEVIMRFSANQAVARPTLGQLSPGISVQPTVLVAQAGNPELEPFKAKQYDLSLEWYFADEGLLAATIFHKDINSFITLGQTRQVITGTNLLDDDGNNVSGSTFLVNRPINGEGGELTGVEVLYQQPFTFLPSPWDGLGMLANVTFSDSEGLVFGERRALVGHSDLSYNMIGYYEKNNYSLRLAWSHRSDYLEIVRQGDDQRVDSRNQLDISAGYDFNDQISLTFDALNVTGEDFYSYHRDKQLNRLLIDQEPVFVFGARYKF